MNKRGQIAFFILLGVFLLVVFGLFLFSQSFGRERTIEEFNEKPTENLPLNNFIETCLKNTMKNGLVDLGVQGGFYAIPYESIVTEYSQVPFYYYEGSLNVPSLEDLQNEFSGYVSQNIEVCFNDFLIFKEQGVGIESEGVEAKTLILNDKIASNIKVPLKIGEQDLRDFRFTWSQDVRLKEIHWIIMHILNQIKEDPYNIHISQLFDLMERHKLQIDSITHSQGSIVYVIQDNSTVINELPYMFIFATKLNTSNQAPKLYTSDLSANVGEAFEYYVEAKDPEGDELVYSSNSELFFVHPESGYINFIPTEESVGDYRVKFSVTDGLASDGKTVDFVVKNG